mmetsp:Transcript_18494/g.44590  ORF Transcript_18494/g.44590 Transcript_18494/m.44590 type:complete len:279 (-) Transcript_18494:27-863(-)
MAPAKYGDFARAPKDFFSAGWFDDKDSYQYKITHKTNFQGASVTALLGNAGQKMTFKWPTPYSLPVSVDKAELTCTGGAAKLAKLDVSVNQGIHHCPGLKLKLKTVAKTNFSQPVVEMEYGKFSDAHLNGNFDVATNKWAAAASVKLSPVVLGAEVTSTDPTKPNLGLQFQHGSGLLAAAYLTGLNPNKAEFYAQYKVNSAVTAAAKYDLGKNSCAGGVGYKVNDETDVKVSLHRDGNVQSARFNIGHLLAAKCRIAFGGGYSTKTNEPTVDFSLQLD